MSARRYGLMRPGGASKIIALLLVVGLVAGFAATYLVQAGLPVWLILLVVMLVVVVPVVAAARSGREDERSPRR